MCGLTGILSLSPLPKRQLRALTKSMTDAITHRGPDSEGAYIDTKAGLALGHRRLSILDLSPKGAQPMHSRDDRWAVAYNGEIYNFAELKAELSALGHSFNGGSDTEVLLAAVVEWGPHEALKRSNGMFAIALWDKRERRLFLARDRVGKKPLYYGWDGDRLLFGSELKALRAVFRFVPELDRDAIAYYLRFNAVPGDKSVYQGVHRLEPGAMREFQLDKVRSGQRGRLTRYWDPAEAVRRGRERPMTESPNEMVERIEATLMDATKIRMESDVPLGAFLSGGVDSSLVVALMQKQSTQAVKTFSIGFHVDGYNEAHHAKAVADHLGTEHTELYVTEEDARNTIPELPFIYDEPFCDVSQIPTLLVSRMAREHVTVALSGDGGDELFAGYERYPFTDALYNKFKPIPKAARSAAAQVVGSPGGIRQRAFAQLTRRLPSALRSRLSEDRVLLLSNLLRQNTPEDFYRYLISVWREPTPVVLGTEAQTVPPMFGVSPNHPSIDEVGEVGSYIDLITYLVDDILVKVDRASMAVSLEARAPLLDYRVVELAWRTPYSVKRKGGLGKWPLQTIVWNHIPREIMERPKMGFGVPIGEWMRGPLKGWASDLLDERRLKDAGIFDPAPIRRRWEEHTNGTRNWAPDLWAILMFEAWRDKNLS